MKQEQSTQYQSTSQNRQKLIQQNIKLYNQIKLLQQKMSTVIALDITRAVQVDNQKKQNKEHKQHIGEIGLQEAYIRNLKIRVKELRALDLGQITRGIVAEENQLVAMKREYQKLCEEKRVLTSKCEDKKTALQYNAPLNQYKSQTQTQLLTLKKSNNEAHTKLLLLQRQTRKYHKYQQMHKQLKNEKIVLQNPEYQFAKIDHEKSAVIKKCKLIEQKWKPQIQALDKEYFQTKDIWKRKLAELGELDRELKNWQNRASAVRNQSDVLQDRDRLAKVITMSPAKKQSLQKQKTPKKQPKIQKKQDVSVVDFFKNLFSKTKPQKQPQHQQVTKPQLNNSNQQTQQKQDIRRWNNLAVETRYGTKSQKVKQSEDFKYSFTKLSEKNQFMNSKHSFEGFDLKPPNKDQQAQPKKNKILTNSVAVGTSFYYNDED